VSREQLLIQTMLELADTLTADYDVVDFLYLLCDRSVEIVGADAAGVLLMNASGGLDVAAASSHDMRLLEQVEADNLQGPCVDAHRSGTSIQEADVAAQTGRWPEYAPEAGAIGYRGVHAHPLLVRDQSVGALNVYRRSVGHFSEADADVLAGLAGMAAIGIVTQRTVSGAETQVTQLQQALDRRAIVDQATAVLADRRGMDHGLAFDSLRRYARNHNQRLRDVAQRFIAGELSADALAPEGS
jgi:GAF domain-containing protein